MTFHEHTLAALERVEGLLPGGRWCEVCRCSGNHTTVQHERAVKQMEEDGRTEP